ncbi:TrmH family RNA methyltransferase [Noviherbaspirillum aridicola]|uniref:RNA methyltransferase n=1 Tax=Noviherbaspirillum aridicola TaxID=2849687 RepID=A0ABQ4Q1Y1_9BURK|nr:RNA methyltransferase [Noviherbaspirillum aridicola]GIZ51203.1 RNA methyltransferase [Noviherbaspirillum aridicola]
MKTITSRDNPLYKQLKLLAGSSQARRKAGRAVLDGVHLCEVYLQQAGEPEICVASESALALPEVASILDRCQSHRVQRILLPDNLYAALSQVEHGVGLMFLVEVPAAPMPARLDGPAVLLDNLQDPGNLGSILRSAAAAGIPRIYCSRNTVFAWSPKVLRAGMGAHFLLQIHENVDLDAILRTAAVPVAATSSHADHRIYDIDLRGPVAWLFGNEGQGVSPELLARATHRLAVPHLGAVESLNVAACAAVCFFEQVRQKTA